jgi:hypothetical protein
MLAKVARPGLPILLVLLLSATWLSDTPTAWAAVARYVNGSTGSDSATCGGQRAPCKTISQAITNAAPGDAIQVAPGTYPEHLTISKPLTITGAGEQQTIVNGSSALGTAVAVAARPVGLARLTVTNGSAIDSPRRGVLNQATAMLTLDHVTVSGNNVGPGTGAGIVNNGTLLLHQSTVSNNTATGGAGTGAGIANYGTATLDQSTISLNEARREGGGIYNTGQLQLNGSTVRDNGAGSGGGGIYSFSADGATLAATLTLNNSTINGNEGGGIENDGGTLTLARSTVSGNLDAKGGGGIYNIGTATITQSLVSNNTTV